MSHETDKNNNNLLRQQQPHTSRDFVIVVHRPMEFVLLAGSLSGVWFPLLGFDHIIQGRRTDNKHVHGHIDDVKYQCVPR